MVRARPLQSIFQCINYFNISSFFKMMISSICNFLTYILSPGYVTASPEFRFSSQELDHKVLGRQKKKSKLSLTLWRVFPLPPPEVGKMPTFYLWPIPWGGGGGMGCRDKYVTSWPQLAMNRFLPLLAIQIPTLWTLWALILDRCRAFDLFASVDAHLTSMTASPVRRAHWIPNTRF